MLDPLVGYQDPQQGLGITFASYNRFKSLGVAQDEDARFDVPGGRYSFVPTIQQTSPGIFSLTFKGTGRFTGSGSGRPAALELHGTVDENSGAVDIQLKADGSSFHLGIAAADISGAVALSKRIAADIRSKNWSDVYAASSPRIKPNYPAFALANDLNAKYRHVSSACRLGPAQYSPAQPPLLLLGDHFVDVVAMTVTDPDGARVDTFAAIVLNREEGSWVFVDGNPPGIAFAGARPQDFGIPAPTP